MANKLNYKLNCKQSRMDFAQNSGISSKQMLSDDFIFEDGCDTRCDDQKEQVMEVEEEDDKQIPGSTMSITQEAEDDIVHETDWENDKDYGKFSEYFKSKISSIPKHSGETIPGCERAMSYCKDLQRELSKAMRGDLDGKIDESWADKQYKKLNDYIDRLKAQINKLMSKSQTKDKLFASVTTRLVAHGSCDNCNCEVPTWHDTENDQVVCLNCNTVVGSNGTDSVVKIAQTPVINIMISAFERAIVSTLLNASVSGGKNIEEIYDKLNKKYKFTDREVLAIRQLLADYGMPMIQDRAKIDENDGENDGEFSENFFA